MSKLLETLIARGRRVRRPKEQREVAFGMADLSTHRKFYRWRGVCEDAKERGVRYVRSICIRSVQCVGAVGPMVPVGDQECCMPARWRVL